MKKKSIIISICLIVLIGIIIFILVPKKDKAVLVAYESKVIDGSYVKLVLDGLKENESIKSDFIDYYPDSYNERINYAKDNKNAKIIVSAESGSKNEMRLFAENYKDVTFINFDAVYDTNLKNLVGITFDMYSSSFLAGFIAGKTTKTNSIGFIGGVDNEVIKEFYDGYAEGAMRANSNIKITTNYVESFSDKDKALALADEMYNNGVDIIFAPAGTSSLGVIASAKNKDKLVIGVDYDQTSLAPNNVLTCVVKDMEVAFDKVLNDYHNKELKQNYKFDLKSGGTGILKTELISKELWLEVDALKEELTK